MVSKKVVVINPEGLHLKPAACFCKEALNFIEIVCDGEDEAEALEAMCRAVENGLGESL